ncbi:hypothetical protein NDN08_007090 [Rhodosorus marinus]|uniref:ASPIC/UnbV domain-containing protein n=1 Tax=Rhodosorus marinus TaxID=101924 RepID=A0AAV8UKS1_9RHOD|nr:hypothetical protein NDN08_007090 [Rhodosorus marinus]
MMMKGLGIVLLVSFFYFALGQGIRKPTFKDVTVRKGLIPRSEMNEWRPEGNKYWGSSIYDVDGDGCVDLILGNHGSPIDFYWGRCKKGFEKGRLGSLVRGDYHATAADDLNGDGLLDIIVTQGGSNGKNPAIPLIVTQQPGREWKVQRGDYGFNEASFRARSMAMIDMDLDGDLDVLFANQRIPNGPAKKHVVYENLGKGRYRVRENTGLEAAEPYWVYPLDANDDGHMDVLFMGFNGVKLYVRTAPFKFRLADGILPEIRETNNSREGYKDARCACEVDIDGDGRLELYIARGRAWGAVGSNDLLFKKTNGKYKDISQRAGIRLEGRHYHVTAGDFNLDGYMDLYVVVQTAFNEPRKNDLLLLNQKNGKFKVAGKHGTESPFNFEDGNTAIALDYNEDGRMDMLVGPRNATWRLYENQTPYFDNDYVTVLVGRPRAGAQQAFANWDRHPMGAVVTVRCGDRRTAQRVGSNGQSHSVSAGTRMHFGIGKCGAASYSVSVDYPGGVQSFRMLKGRNKKVVTGLFYDKCETGFTGMNCSRKVDPCRSTGCPKGRSCEIVKKGTRKLWCPV